jgi:PAS domain S-box-containing protein
MAFDSGSCQELCTSQPLEALAEANLRALAQRLQVRQIELEMQIDEFRRAQTALGALSDIGPRKLAEEDLKASEERYRRLDRLYAALLTINQTVVGIKSRGELFDQVCRITTEGGNFRVAWIGLHNPETHEVIPVAHAGNDRGYVGKIRVYADDRPEGRGPTGSCIREGRPVVYNDFQVHPRAWPWHEPAVQHGLRAVAALPICFRGEVFAALTVYAGEANVFQEKEIALLEEAATAVSSALESLEREAERRRAERALRESEEKFRVIANYTVDWENWLGPDRKLLWVSPSVERITGYTAAECYAMPDYPLPLIAEEDRERIAELFRRPATHSRDEDFEVRIARKDGPIRWISVSWQPIFGDDGVFLGHRAGARDITESKRLQRELALREQELESFFRCATAGLALFDHRLRYVRINDMLARMNGLPTAEHLGRTVREVIPRMAPVIESNLQRALASGEPVTDVAMSGEMPGQPGVEQHWVSSYFPVVGAAGKPSGVGVVVVDVTDRKRAEDGLRKAIAYNRRLIEASLDPLVTIGPNGKIIDVNQATETATGFPRLALIGTDFADYFSDPERAHAGYRQVLTAGWVRDYALDLKHRDGSVTPVLYNASLYYDDRGQIGGIFAAARDITERRRTEEMERRLRQRDAELAHMNRLHAVGEMAAALAHELNQPLYAINNYLRGIERRLKKQHSLADLDSMSGAIDQVSQEVSRAAEIVANLRGFVRGHATKRSKVDIGQLLEQAVELLRPLGHDKSVALELDVADDLPSVLADPTQIEQVVVNLLANAVEAVAGLPPGRRKVAVSGRLTKTGSIEIAVRDRGAGIPADLKDKVFEPFVTTKENGLGVGLAISRSIVESHGGAIWVVENEPHGAAFHFTIPLIKGQDHES